MSKPQRIFLSTRSVYLWSLSIVLASQALFVVPFALLHGRHSIRMHPTHLALAMLLIYAHELLHVLGFRVFGGVARDDISIRIAWRYLTPHVDLRVPVAVRRWRFAALLPGVVTGLLPVIAALALGNGPMVVVGALMIGAAGGDVALVAALRGLDPGAQVELDAVWARHPV
jgi:hypothetical protein